MKMELNYSTAIENICQAIDYILELKQGQESLTIFGCEDEISEETENILNELLINLDGITFDLINNLLKVKKILNYNDKCDYETIQDEYQNILEKGSKGYYQLLKKYNLNKEEFEKIIIK